MSRPAVPVSETPEVDAVLTTEDGAEIIVHGDTLVRLAEKARSLERRLSLARTEIKGHMRVAKEANQRAEAKIWELHNAEARIAELEEELTIRSPQALNLMGLPAKLFTDISLQQFGLLTVHVDTNIPKDEIHFRDGNGRLIGKIINVQS